MRCFLFALGFLSVACSDTSNVDLDGDGYSAIDDCDDDNNQINPGMDEVCDGIDNNCDGEIDANPVDGVQYFADRW